jgi:hypothetical protein
MSTRLGPRGRSEVFATVCRHRTLLGLFRGTVVMALLVALFGGVVSFGTQLASNMAATPKPLPVRTSAPPAASRPNARPGTSRPVESLSGAPAGLRRVATKALEHDDQRDLAVSYRGDGAHLRAEGGTFTIGLGTEGRPHAPSAARSPGLVRSTYAATYSTGPLVEKFRNEGNGLEQTFRVATRPRGSGPLIISVPLVGARATGTGTIITVHVGRQHGVVATYSGLSVSAADGKHVAASMAVEKNGSAIDISVDDRGAAYPLTIDPTWSVDQTLTSTICGIACGSYVFGIGNTIPLAMSGPEAVVGNPTAGDEGGALVFTQVNGTWAESASLTVSGSPPGDEGEGNFVAISGDTIVLTNSLDEGPDAVVFTGSGAVWTQTAVLGNTSGEALNGPAAISGNTIAVDGRDSIYGCGGTPSWAVFMFTYEGGSWNLSTVVEDPASACNFGFGSYAIALQGPTLVVGDPFNTYGGVPGNVWIFNRS